MSDNEGPGWERRVLEGLALATLREQRIARRWGIFFKLAFFAYLTYILALIGGWGSADALTDGKHTALIELQGVIDAESEASADKIDLALQNAFDDRNTSGVIIRVNSPGGSPVQAGIISDEIHRLRGLHPEIPLYVVVEDICASGGYYVAAAADRIYVNKASIVGSIGVLMDGFGFTGTMDKLGVERRLYTAGTNKGFLDPFSPVDSTQRKYAQTMLDDIHQQFIGVVRAGRGNRLKNDPTMFSGLMWTGQRSIELGLADDLGTVDSVARDVIKATDIVDYTQKDKLVERVAKRIGAGVGSKLNLLPFAASGWRVR
jgi:protease IV